MKAGTIHQQVSIKQQNLILDYMQPNQSKLQKGKKSLTIRRDIVVSEETPDKKTSMAVAIPVMVLAVSTTAIMLMITMLKVNPVMITIITMLVTIILIMAMKILLTVVPKMSAQATATEWSILSEDHPVLLMNHLAEHTVPMEVFSKEQAITA